MASPIQIVAKSRRSKTYAEENLDTTDRESAISDHEQLIALHKCQLKSYQEFVEHEKLLIAALENELKYLNDINDKAFDISISSRTEGHYVDE